MAQAMCSTWRNKDIDGIIRGMVRKSHPAAAVQSATWQVYVVRCADGSLYTGIARDVVRRVSEHNGGNGLGASYTRSRRPVVLVYCEAAADRSAASRREYEIKQLSRAEKLALIAASARA